MSRSARYVTPRIFGDNIIGRPLSDKRIAFYQAQGRYGPQQKKLAVKRPKRNTLAELMKAFG